MPAVDQPQPINYASADHPRKWPVKQILLIGAAVFALGFGTCNMVLTRARTKAFQIHTASSLRQVGQGIYMYAHDLGKMPPDLASVFATQQIDAAAFVCALSDDTRAPGATLEQQLRVFAQPGHCSFIYVGASLPWTPPANAVLAFDNPDHQHEYVAVLWGDGSVDDVPLPTIVHILEELSAGRNPPRLPATLTMDQAQDIYKRKWRGRVTSLQNIEPATRPASGSR